jgi:ABC-type transport system involved in cytochrome c biogenesis permease component
MIIWKDLKAEFRSHELLTAMLVFALLVILMFNFALELDIGFAPRSPPVYFGQRLFSPASWD